MKDIIEALPIYISVAFLLTTIVTLLLFYWVIRSSSLEKVSKNAHYVLIGLTFWLVVQGVLTFYNVYNTVSDSFPPKIALFGVMPFAITIVFLFVTKNGKQFIDSLSIEKLTYLNAIRIPVELVLYGLFLHNAVPELMTFAGRNFDILAGITAPFAAYFGFRKKKLNSSILLIWNCISLGLLVNIVINAVLSIPSPFQQFGFEQPNIALINFPFSWLPVFIVPIVLFGHLASIRQLLKKQ